MSRRYRAFTIIEMLVVCTLTVLLFGIAYTLLLPMIKEQLRTSMRIEIQEEGMVAADKILDDLNQCVAGGIGTYNQAGQPSGVSMHAVVDNDYDGGVLPSNRIYSNTLRVYYWNPGDQKLYLHVFSGAADPAWAAMGSVAPSTHYPIRPPTATAWAALFSTPTLDRRIASDVSAFSVLSANTNNPAQMEFPLAFNLRMTRVGPQGEQLSYQLTRSVVPRNVK